MSGTRDARLPRALRQVAARLGVHQVERMDRPDGETLLLTHATGRAVVKRFAPSRTLDRSRAVMRDLRTAAPVCPRLLAVAPADDSAWYGVFEYLVGMSGSLVGVDEVVALLGQVGAARTVPDWSLEDQWLERLRDGLADDPSALHVLDELAGAPPDGERTLAHGDVAPANIVVTADGPALVDWVEMGSAAPGFDAGRLLAMARLGAAPAWPPTELRGALHRAGYPADNLAWFERLALLRFLYRARTLPMAPELASLIIGSVRRELAGTATAPAGAPGAPS